MALYTSQAKLDASITESKFSRESRKVPCHKRDFCSGNEEPCFPKPSARSIRTEQTPPLSEQAPSSLLRLAHISPILGLAKAHKDFSSFFSPQQKSYLPRPKPHTAKDSSDNCHFWAFLLKTKLNIYFTFCWGFFSDKTPKRADQDKMQHFVHQKGLSLLGIGSITMA